MKSIVKSTPTHKGVSLSKVREIRKLYGEMQSLFLAALEKAIRMGEILSGIKEELPHGQFQSWISNSGLPFKMSTARLYMQLYNRKEEILTAGINGVAEAQKFLSSGGVDDEEKRQSIGVLETPIISNDAASGQIEIVKDKEVFAIKLTPREQQLVAAIVTAGGDKQSAEFGIKAEKLRAKKERERKQKEKQLQSQRKAALHFKNIEVPPQVYRRFSRLSKQTGRPIVELLTDAADALTRKKKGN